MNNMAIHAINIDLLFTLSPLLSVESRKYKAPFSKTRPRPTLFVPRHRRLPAARADNRRSRIPASGNAVFLFISSWVPDRQPRARPLLCCLGYGTNAPYLHFQTRTR